MRAGEEVADDDTGCLEEPGVPADEEGVRVFLASTLGETSSLRLFPETSRRGSFETGVSLDSFTGRALVGNLGILEEGVDAMLGCGSVRNLELNLT